MIRGLRGRRPLIQGQTLRILCFILSEYDRAHLLTVREIGQRFGIRSPNAVKQALDRLRSAGMVTWEDGQPRTLRPLVRLLVLPTEWDKPADPVGNGTGAIGMVPPGSAGVQGG